MVVVIAPEQDMQGEIAVLIQLFQAGLECYHLRKPAKNLEGWEGYLNQIDPSYHNRIVVHSHHILIDKFNLKGIHFQEHHRKNLMKNNPNHYLKTLHLTGKTLSSSFHETEDVVNCQMDLNYHLLSPVFSSISKEGYEGRGFDVNHIDKTVIGMGGVTASNIEAVKTLGFKGVGVLGGIWNSADPIDSFMKIKAHFD